MVVLRWRREYGRGNAAGRSEYGLPVKASPGQFHGKTAGRSAKVQGSCQIDRKKMKQRCFRSSAVRMAQHDI